MLLSDLGITGGAAISVSSAGTLSPHVGVAAAAVAAGSAVSISGVVDITAGLSMIISKSSGGSDGESSYYKKGKPQKPENSELVRKDTRNVNSQQIKEFIRKQGKSFKQNEWKKVMETWRDANGHEIERHYWRHKSGEIWYHN